MGLSHYRPHRSLEPSRCIASCQLWLTSTRLRKPKQGVIPCSESEDGEEGDQGEGESAEELSVATLDGDEAELEIVEVDEGTLELSGVLREEVLRLNGGLGGVLDAGDDDVEVSVLALASVELRLVDCGSSVALRDEVKSSGGARLEGVVEVRGTGVVPEGVVVLVSLEAGLIRVSDVVVLSDFGVEHSEVSSGVSAGREDSVAARVADGELLDVSGVERLVVGKIDEVVSAEVSNLLLSDSWEATSNDSVGLVHSVGADVAITLSTLGEQNLGGSSLFPAVGKSANWLSTTEGAVNAEVVSTADALLAWHILFVWPVGVEVGNSAGNKQSNDSNLSHFQIGFFLLRYLLSIILQTLGIYENGKIIPITIKEIYKSQIRIRNTQTLILYYFVEIFHRLKFRQLVYLISSLYLPYLRRLLYFPLDIWMYSAY